MNNNPTLSNESQPESTVDWDEAMEQARAFQHYVSISNNEHLRRSEKWMGLKSVGVSDQECEVLCRPKELDREQVMRDVTELIKADRKELERWNRQNRTLRSEPNLDKQSIISKLDDAKLREIGDKKGI